MRRSPIVLLIFLAFVIGIGVFLLSKSGLLTSSGGVSNAITSDTLVIDTNKLSPESRERLQELSLNPQKLNVFVSSDPINLIFRFSHAETDDLMSGIRLPEIKGDSATITLYVNPTIKDDKEAFIREINR